MRTAICWTNLEQTSPPSKDIDLRITHCLENNGQESDSLSSRAAKLKEERLQSMERNATDHVLWTPEAVFKKFLNTGGVNHVTTQVSVELLDLKVTQTHSGSSEEASPNDDVDNEVDTCPRVRLKYLSGTEFSNRHENLEDVISEMVYDL